jgi:hypothetical protein
VLDVLADEGGDTPSHRHLTGDQATVFQLQPSGDSITLSLESSGRVATVFVFFYAFHNPVLNQDRCQFQGQAIVQGT